MSQNNWIAVLLALLMLTACATKNQPPETAKAAPSPVIAAPSPAPIPESRTPIEAGGGMPVEKSFHPLVPARDFCIKGAQCGSEYGAYGYIVFTKRPLTEKDKQRYLSICREYLSALEPPGKFPHIARSQIATTFWLLESQPKDENSCVELVDLYDYARATEIATSIRKLGSTGPILVASGKPDTPQAEQTELLIIDLSRLTDNAMNYAFGIWKNKISQDKSYWGKGFNVPLIVAEFRSFIEIYGSDIIQIVHPA